MKRKYIFAILATLTLLCSCNNGNEESEAAETSITNDSHNTQNSLNWSGTYSNDSIAIQLNTNMTFVKITATITETGDFAWDVDGEVIALVNNLGNVSLLKVEENRLTDGGSMILTKEKFQ